MRVHIMNIGATKQMPKVEATIAQGSAAVDAFVSNYRYSLATCVVRTTILQDIDTQQIQ